MKKFFSLISTGMVILLCTTSCASIFTKGKQDVMFKGIAGTTIYDNKGKYLGQIRENGFTEIPIRKKIGNKQVTARLEDHMPRELTIESKFNPVSVINLLSPVGWLIDIATGKVCKYKNDVIDVTLIPADSYDSNSGNSQDIDDGWINY